MKNTAVLCGLAAFALAVTGCGQASPDTHEADAKALRDNETQWNRDFASKDLDKLVAHYAADAVLISPGTPVSSGTDAIRKTLKAIVDDPALSLKFQASKVEVAKAGDLAWTQGSYTMTMTDPSTKRPVNDHGSYLTTFRKQPDGTWKAVADIASSEAAPSAPAPAAAKARKPRPNKRRARK